MYPIDVSIFAMSFVMRLSLGSWYMHCLGFLQIESTHRPSNNYSSIISMSYNLAEPLHIGQANNAVYWIQ